MDKKTLNKIADHPLQSWQWGEFRKAWGNEVIRNEFGQFTLHPLPFTNLKIASFIRGPKPTKEMFNRLKSTAKLKNIVAYKLEPNLVINKLDPKTSKNSLDKLVKTDKNLEKLVKSYRLVKGKTLFTPSTFWIDLTKSEEALLASFHSKTRYNIRYAAKNKVVVKEDNSDKAFNAYIRLKKETIKRQGFYDHSEKYHRLMWKYLHQDMVKNNERPIARLLTATYKGEIMTTWILFVWKDFLYYPYGASTDKYKNVQASSAILWGAIKYGKGLSLKTFDLWGREPGKGFTKFKEGFNPSVIYFWGSRDLVISPFYYFYRIAEMVRWPILRFKSKLIKPSF